MLRLALALMLTAPLADPSFIYDNPVADQAIRQAIKATYDFNLVEARRVSRGLQRSLPDHPVGFILDAETYWWEAQNDSTREDIEEEYFNVQNRGIDIGEKALKAGKYPAVEIRAYLATAWGSKARFRLTQHGVGYKTVMDGRHAHNYAEDVYKADPAYTDILVGIGAYNYFTGKIPGVLKPFAWLLGARGDAATGLKQMNTAMESGRYAKTEARIVLFTALMQDGQYEKSFELVKQLMADHPDNPVLYKWVTEWYRSQKKNLEGAEYFEKLATAKMPTSTKLAQYALFEKAVLLNANRQPADARTTLSRLTAAGLPDLPLGRNIKAFEAKLKR